MKPHTQSANLRSDTRAVLDAFEAKVERYSTLERTVLPDIQPPVPPVPIQQRGSAESPGTMRLNESVKAGVEIFALEGEIDLHYAPVLRSLFQAKVKARTPALVLDLSKVEHIDSTGLAAIIEYFRDTAKTAGLFCLVGLNQNLKSIFEIVKLDKAIPMFETLPAALAALQQGALQPPPGALFGRPAA